MFARVLRRDAEYQSVMDAFRFKQVPVSVTGLAAVNKSLLVRTLWEDLRGTALILVPDEAEGERMCADLKQMGMNCAVYPVRDFVWRDMEGHSREYERQRVGVLSGLLDYTLDGVICCADAALQLTIPPEELKKRTANVMSGENVSPEMLSAALLSAGYERTEQVEGYGQFARRGGILDFFPPNFPQPVRVEFWGDEIDSAHYFDPETQRRTEPVEDLRLTPSVEAIIDRPEELAEAIRKLAASLRGNAAQKAKEILEEERNKLTEGRTISSADKYLPMLYGGKTACLLDYFGKNTRVFVSETVRVRERMRAVAAREEEEVKQAFAEGVLCRGLDCYLRDWTEAVRFLEAHDTVYLDSFPHGSFDTPVRAIVNMTARQLSVWGGGLDVLREDLAPALERKWTCVVMAGTAKSAQVLTDDLRAAGIPARFEEEPHEVADGFVTVMPGGLSAGMEYPGGKFLLITHGTPTQERPGRRKSFKQGKVVRSLADLAVGDYVVHEDHGIGVYEGVQKVEMDGIIKDYIRIRYAGGSKLFLPVTQMDQVAKYVGADGEAEVKLNRMGGSEWQKTKARVRASVKDIARELIALYAKRMQSKGYAFPADEEWQRDFEAHFEYNETQDQLRCIGEIKNDMERPVPMDRLLCGDVGFGKTEVALRAAFKCITDSKQCALLVPTTILAWQHYQTVLKRMDGFPVRVGLLSRFRTPKQQEATIQQLRAGEIDMVIGTHRLVQKDVKFRDLGLVIIDEEQRFGVAQKEKLKSMCENVDVLTLSATPIPRTLNMALSGIRDMSVLEEAPQDRRPIQTFVMEHDDGIIAEAIRRELRRGGQVYYLHNRVETILSTAARIQRSVPEARIGVAHGKMEEEELSEVWRQLIEQEIDVLVCTTIIETGVDVPNANTLVIENADRMGLSQLHQLRGRVGRSSRRAFAYFTFRKGKELSEVATKRLTAIREFTEFGSGFQIAMRDMEIRGAGNILGAQQHGHMEAVGYELYFKLLNEAIAMEKGEAPPVEEADCRIDVKVQAHIPESFIESANRRLDAYRRIADIRSEEDADDVLDELIDRYGDPPSEVTGLVEVALLRSMARKLHISVIRQNEGNLQIYQKPMDRAAVARLANNLRGRVRATGGNDPCITVSMRLPVLKECRKILTMLTPVSNGEETAEESKKDE